jgi:hypothetical protein
VTNISAPFSNVGGYFLPICLEQGGGKNSHTYTEGGG